MATINDPGPVASGGSRISISGGSDDGSSGISSSNRSEGGSRFSRSNAKWHLFLSGALLFLIGCLSVPPVQGFNVDTVNYVLHEGAPNSMFGFSVVLHQEQQRSWLVCLILSCLDVGLSQK